MSSSSSTKIATGNRALETNHCNRSCRKSHCHSDANAPQSHELIFPILQPDGSIWKYVSWMDIARFIKGKIPEEVTQDEVVFRDREGHWIMMYAGEKVEQAQKYLENNGLDVKEELSKEKKKMEGS
ncbi:uncharacterized protein L199_003694 [Kwoniella botswanensis]|uniref:uncharacterized protein n=1 Tax=Kwoniella botswanensis TaxID=1268659 RepID=UPI00315D4AEA